LLLLALPVAEIIFSFFLSWSRRVAYRAFSCLLLLVDTLVVVGVTGVGGNFFFFFELEQESSLSCFFLFIVVVGVTGVYCNYRCLFFK